MDGPLSKPEFDVVTGVSTGALIAPFAFLGDDKSIESVLTLYRNPRPDWVKTRWPFYFLPANESFATVPGLEREMRAIVDMAMLHRVAAASRQGRSLLVNTSDVDNGGHWVWDVGSEAERAAEMATAIACIRFFSPRPGYLARFLSARLTARSMSTAALQATSCMAARGPRRIHLSRCGQTSTRIFPYQQYVFGSSSTINCARCHK